jgi:hypothetical protein
VPQRVDGQQQGRALSDTCQSANVATPEVAAAPSATPMAPPSKLSVTA